MDILEPEPVLRHFSHQHPLKLISYPTSTTNRILCSACDKSVTGWTYICESCNYSLHKVCSKFPQKLIHNVDTKHALTLLSSPAYEGGEFACNACGSTGSGFCYHCTECQIDLHAVCSFMPQSIMSKNHEHAVNLCFKPPYENEVFQCDICEGSGSNHWLYRCELCEFDAHIKCAKATQKPISTSENQNQQP